MGQPGIRSTWTQKAKANLALKSTADPARKFNFTKKAPNSNNQKGFEHGRTE